MLRTLNRRGLSVELAVVQRAFGVSSTMPRGTVRTGMCSILRQCAAADRSRFVQDMLACVRAWRSWPGRQLQQPLVQVPKTHCAAGSTTCPRHRLLQCPELSTCPPLASPPFASFAFGSIKADRNEQLRLCDSRHRRPWTVPTLVDVVIWTSDTHAAACGVSTPDTMHRDQRSETSEERTHAIKRVFTSIFCSTGRTWRTCRCGTFVALGI